MGSNPPIKAIPTSVAEPNKHIAMFLRSTKPFTDQFASRGREYFVRSRAAGDVLTEEDWRRDYYDVRKTTTKKTSVAATALSSSSSRPRHSQLSPTALSPANLDLERQESSAPQPGPPVMPPKRFPAPSRRPSPYARQSMDLPHYDHRAHGVTTSANKVGRGPALNLAAETRERHLTLTGDSHFGQHMHHPALGRAVTTGRIISPPPEVDTRRDPRRSVPSAPKKKQATELDELQTAIQNSRRLTHPRTGILARGVMSQPVKLNPGATFNYDVYAMGGMHDGYPMAQSYMNATEAALPCSHTVVSHSIMPLSPPSPNYSHHSGSVPWSPWATGMDSPSHPHNQYQPPTHQHHRHHLGQQHFGRNEDCNTPAHAPGGWLDAIGSLYGLGNPVGADAGGDAWLSANIVLAPTADGYERHERPFSAPLPDDGVYGLAYGHRHGSGQLGPIGTPAIVGSTMAATLVTPIPELTCTPSIELDQQPYGAATDPATRGMWSVSPRSGSPGGWGQPHQVAEAAAWAPTSPATPVSPSEIITLGLTPKQQQQQSSPPALALEQHAPEPQPHEHYNGYSTGVHWQQPALAATTRHARAAFPALQKLSLQSPLSHSLTASPF